MRPWAWALVLAAGCLASAQLLRHGQTTAVHAAAASVGAQQPLLAAPLQAIDLVRYNTLLAAGCQRTPGCQQPARLLAGPAPHYPPLTQAQGRAGHADIGFVITADGSTVQIRILGSSEPVFAQAARAAIADWQLQPAQYAGQDAPHSRIRLEFALGH